MKFLRMVLPFYPHRVEMVETAHHRPTMVGVVGPEDVLKFCMEIPLITKPIFLQKGGLAEPMDHYQREFPEMQEHFLTHPGSSIVFTSLISMRKFHFIQPF